MELNCKHNRNPNIIKIIDHAQLHVKIAYCSRASAEIFPGRQRRYFAYYFQVADDAAQMNVHKTLPFLHHKDNSPCYGNSHKNALVWQP